MSLAKLMKGKSFKDYKHKVKYPLVAEIKLDEIRLDVRTTRGEETKCEVSEVVQRVFFRSYADKPLHNLGVWSERFAGAMYIMGIERLDMGVLVNRSFDATYRYVRSSKGLPDDLKDAQVEFLLFDHPEQRMEFRERMYYLDRLADHMRTYELPVIRPPRVEVHSEDRVYRTYTAARDEGYEGLMLKTLDHKYELGKRTNGWLKVKPEDDADGIITEVLQAHSMEGEPLDRAGSVRIVCEDGSSADCGGIDHELGRAMLAHPEQFIGQWAEFVYMERDRQGGYRHPRFNRIREAKA